MDREDMALGVGGGTTRRDFMNGKPVSGTCPLVSQAPVGDDLFSGFGGVGDYARANGNTLPVLTAAHRVRDGYYEQFPPADTGDDVETVDLLIVGSGLSGLMAAKEYTRLTGGHKQCLILDNHLVLGGEARQNEFLVDGVPLLGPQGSNDFFPPDPNATTPMGNLFRECGIPYEYTYQKWDSPHPEPRFSLDNYSNMDGFNEDMVDVAYRFTEKDGAKAPYWTNNIWRRGLEDTPFSQQTREALLRWRHGEDHQDLDDRALDRMDYRTFLEKICGYPSEVTTFHQPVVGLLGGVSADAISARYGRHLVTQKNRLTLSFPGGNTLFARCLAGQLIPGLFPRGTSFSAIQRGPFDPAALDRPNPVRIRQNAMVVSVRHHNGDAAARTVDVTYVRDGCVRHVKAGAVVMATGGWITKHVVKDLPDDIMEAYSQFFYAPALIANVALKNWRFLYRLGTTAVRWTDDGTMFGFCANIRRTMVMPDYAPPLDPARPALLTFYMGLYTPGLSAWEQGARGRMRLLSTSYLDYERIIRSQMANMFADVGFDPKRDIDGIILNRWGHARVIQTPNFYYGVNGRPAPREVVARGFGRIVLAHSELNGAQNATGAFEHGMRAAREVASWN